MPERVVNHPKYGRGVVLQSRYKGFELLVKFDNGIKRWVRIDETTEIPQVAMVPPTPLVPQPPQPSTPQSFKSRRMIEAFRCGIVPHDCVDDFTFGREREIQKLMNWLMDPEESTLLLVGEYGTGKTHLLNYAYWRALRENFAVAYVEMDPNETPFHKFKRVYARLVQTFRFCSKGGKLKSFREFLKEAFVRGAFKDHIYFKYLIEHDDDIFWEWIEGSESIPRPVERNETHWGYWVNRYNFLPGLYDYSTAANIYCYLLSSLGWAAKEILGLKGLLLVFDEGEALEISDYYQFEKGLNFLKALIRTAEDDEQLLAKFRNTGLDCCAVGAGWYTPFLYRQPSKLKLLFAFTPAVVIEVTEELESARRIELQPLTDAALKTVFEHICLLYDGAYGFLEDDLMIDMILRRVVTRGGRTRLFVKGAVEALDLARLNHGQPLDEVLR